MSVVNLKRMRVCVCVCDVSVYKVYNMSEFLNNRFTRFKFRNRYKSLLSLKSLIATSLMNKVQEI